MTRRWFFWFLAAACGLGPAGPAAAQFRWQPGQVLTYRAEQVTTAVDVAEDNRAETTTKLHNVKRWQVLAVDEAGVATLQLSLTALRIETKPPSGDPVVFDSSAPDKGDAGLREQLSRYLNTPLAVLRVDATGKVVEVKESKFGPASRYESDPPFLLTLPAGPLREGSAWQRDYRITLEPPQGTGEKYEASQRYVCKAVDGGRATVALSTTVGQLPEAPADQVPLLQFQPQGEVVFDTRSGVLRSARLQIDREIKGHQDEGSSYRFQSTYTEELVTDP